MNTDTEKQAQQHELAAQLYRTGHPWTTAAGSPNDGYDPAHFIASGIEIRPVLVTPEDGREIRNPANLTAEQVGVGYKLTLVEQISTPVQLGAQYWNRGQWNSSNSQLYCSGHSYRIPLSTPYPDPKPADPYAELKKAHAEGKVIETFWSKGWTVNPSPDWTLAPQFYRVKPWTMPEPPAGRQWHKPEVLTQKDWEDGWRAFLVGEKIQAFYEFSSDGGKTWNNGVGCHVLVGGVDYPMRTKRPLPVEPVKPEPKWGPLGPEDVPPGSVVRLTDPTYRACWLAVISVLSTQVAVPSTVVEGVSHVSYQELMDNWQILLPGQTEWQPCRKEVRA